MLKNGVWYNGAELDCNNHISGIFSAEPFLKGGRGVGVMKYIALQCRRDSVSRNSNFRHVSTVV